MPRIGMKNLLLLMLVFISSVNSIYQCSSIADPSCENNKRKFPDEIDDLNEYMQIVVDKLSDDDIIVVRASRTILTNSDVGNESPKSKSEAQTSGESILSTNSEAVASMKLDDESRGKDENVSLISERIFGTKEPGFTVDETPFEAEHFEQSINANREIRC